MRTVDSKRVPVCGLLITSFLGVNRKLFLGGLLNVRVFNGLHILTYSRLEARRSRV